MRLGLEGEDVLFQCERVDELVISSTGSRGVRQGKVRRLLCLPVRDEYHSTARSGLSALHKCMRRTG